MQVDKKDREVLFCFFKECIFILLKVKKEIIPQFSVSGDFVNFTTSKPCDFL